MILDLLKLSRIAEGVFAQRDIDLLESRKYSLDRSIASIPKDIIRLHALNADVDAYNETALASFEGPLVFAFASDDISNNASREFKEKALADFHLAELTDRTLNAGLHPKINLKVGGIYKVTTNISVSDGLYNGCAGKLEHISYSTHPKSMERVPGVLFMSFQKDIGMKTRSEFFSKFQPRDDIDLRIGETWVPVTLKKTQIQRYDCNIDRIQFPIVPAHARTYHCSQGQTWDRVVCNISGHVTKEHFYVGLSRVTSIDGLYLLGDVKIP